MIDIGMKSLHRIHCTSNERISRPVPYQFRSIEARISEDLIVIIVRDIRILRNRHGHFVPKRHKVLRIIDHGICHTVDQRRERVIQKTNVQNNSSCQRSGIISARSLNTASGFTSDVSISPICVSPESTRIPQAPFFTPVATSV